MGPSERESAYELFQRGSRLLSDGHPGAAAMLLERAAHLEPGKESILEALGRAYYGQGQPALVRHRSGGRQDPADDARSTPADRGAAGPRRRTASGLTREEAALLVLLRRRAAGEKRSPGKVAQAASRRASARR